MAYTTINGKVVKSSKNGKKSNLSGYRPDAGMNSKKGTNYYWFQVAELIQTLSIQPKVRVGLRNGKVYVELNTSVDIMDYEGNKHMVRQTEEGYFATLCFPIDTLNELADQIDKGAMCVRVAGVPAETQTTIVGEKFKCIDVQNSWSAGNDLGYMAYMVMTPTGMNKTDSKVLANKFRTMATQLTN